MKCLRCENEVARWASSRAEKQFSFTTCEVVVLNEVFAACRLLVSTMVYIVLSLSELPPRSARTTTRVLLYFGCSLPKGRFSLQS